MFRLVRCTCLVFKQSSLDKTISSYLKLSKPKLFCKFRKTSAPFIRENLNNSHKSFSRVVKTNKQNIQQADPFPRTKQKTEFLLLQSSFLHSPLFRAQALRVLLSLQERQVLLVRCNPGSVTSRWNFSAPYNFADSTNLLSIFFFFFLYPFVMMGYGYVSGGKARRSRIPELLKNRGRKKIRKKM